jgi:hypothetical protein
MFILDESVIESTIASTSAFIVTRVAEEIGQPAEEVAQLFQHSKTAVLLRDPSTGYYWDSIPELITRFKGELDTGLENTEFRDAVGIVGHT